jgi:hypothetical protein
MNAIHDGGCYCLPFVVTNRSFLHKTTTALRGSYCDAQHGPPVPRGHWLAIRVTEVAPPATSTFGTATLRGTSAGLRHHVDRIYGRFQIRALVKMCSDRPGSCEFPICSSKASTMQPGHIHHPKPRGVSTIVRPARFDPSTTASFVSPLAIDAHAIVTSLLSSHRFINAPVERGARDLTVIANDTARLRVHCAKICPVDVVLHLVRRIARPAAFLSETTEIDPGRGLSAGVPQLRLREHGPSAEYPPTRTPQDQ